MSAIRETVFDICIVGAGPVGLFTTFYAGMRQMKIALIDSLPEPGGQLTALYPEKYIYDMPGFPKIMAKDLATGLWQQTKIADATTFFGEKVLQVQTLEEFSPGKPLYALELASGKKVFTKTMVLAVGMGAFSPQKLKVSGIDSLEGTHVHYFVHKLNRFADRDLLIVGGGDSAADWTHTFATPVIQSEGGGIESGVESGVESRKSEKRNSLDGKRRTGKPSSQSTQAKSIAKPIAKSVTLIHRSDKFRCHEATLAGIRANTQASIEPFTEVQSVTKNAAGKLSVELIKTKSKKTETREFDDIIVCIGYLSNLDFVNQLELNISKKCIEVSPKMETSKPGIFAAGDGCIHPGKIKLIATGVGEAAMAANFAKTYIDPDSRAFPGHSTSVLANRV